CSTPDIWRPSHFCSWTSLSCGGHARIRCGERLFIPRRSRRLLTLPENAAALPESNGDALGFLALKPVEASCEAVLLVPKSAQNWPYSALSVHGADCRNPARRAA